MFKNGFPSPNKSRKIIMEKVLPNEIRQDFFILFLMVFGSFVGIGLFVSMQNYHKVLLGI